MSAWRRIIVREVEYTWRYGSEWLVVRRDGKTTIRAPLTEVLGMTWADIERGQWKRYLAVTPRHVRNLIEARVS